MIAALRSEWLVLNRVRLWLAVGITTIAFSVVATALSIAAAEPGPARGRGISADALTGAGGATAAVIYAVGFGSILLLAAFTSTAGPDGGPTPGTQQASAGVAIVEPAPTLTKSNNKPSPATVSAGTTVTYTLTAKNTTGHPPLHDGWVVDCLPGTLTFTMFSAIPAGTTATTQPGANGASGTSTACATGTTEIDWNVGDLAPGAPAVHDDHPVVHHHRRVVGDVGPRVRVRHRVGRIRGGLARSAGAAE